MEQSDSAAEASADRFRTRGMAGAIAAFLLAVLVYVQPTVSNDGLSYLGFLRRLLGEQRDGYAYQFGSAFWNLPWYLAARLLDAVGIGRIGGLDLADASLMLGSVAAVLLLFPLGWLLLRDLGLARRAPRAVLLTIFGTPLFYSVLFSPYDAHSVDALAGTAFALLLLRVTTGPVVSVRAAVTLGTLLGAMATVRYANLALAAGAVVAFASRRAWRPGVVAALAALVVGGALFALPALRGMPYGVTADPTHQAVAGGVGGEIDVDLLVPLKMLFTLKRGLFVWTPLTVLSVAGIVLLWRRDRGRRLFTTSLCVSALGLLLVHIAWGKYWFGGFGFSARFLTGLFPLFLVGLAELVSRRPAPITVLATACVAWSGFLGLYHFYGYQGISGVDGADRIVGLYRSGEETPQKFARMKVAHPAKERLEAYARLVGR